MRDMDTLMADTMKDAERRIIRSVNGVTGVPTGLTDLDRMTSGWQDGDLVVLAARPSVGKTALALHLARSAAMAGRAVVVYSLGEVGRPVVDGGERSQPATLADRSTQRAGDVGGTCGGCRTFALADTRG